MDNGLKYIKLPTFIICILSAILFLPVLPIGLVLAGLWLYFGESVTNKRSFVLQNTGLLVITLGIVANHFRLINPYLHQFVVLNTELALSLTSPHNFWLQLKSLMFNFGLIWVIPLQIISLANLFLLPGLKAKVPRVNKATSALMANGTLIGTEVPGNTPLIISDAELNGHVYVGGTTGSGKTVTLKNFIMSAIERNIPLIYVDGKADQKLPLEIKAMCEQYGREFKLFAMNPKSRVKYNPLAIGGFTELKDKIITLKSSDSSASRFYQTAEGEYLQFLFKVLQKADKHIDLYTLGYYISMPRLFELIGELGDVALQNEARELRPRLQDKLDGLIGDINTFIKSDIGHLFECRDGDTVINLDQDIQAGNIIYFSLNDLNYPDYANRLGKLIINDLKSVFGRIDEARPIKTFAIFDEFTTYAGEQFNTILSRTRSKGLHAIVGSQSFDTIDKISPKLASDLMANCNTFIIHRQNSDIDAKKLSALIGKTQSYEVAFNQSTTLNTTTKAKTSGSTRTVKVSTVNKIPPDKIQVLPDGSAYVLRKKAGSKVSLVKIRFIGN